MPDPSGRSPLLAATVLGIGLGGFFDGIMLHQVLQWHHLLSLVPGEAFRDLGNQILADGLFHILTYAVTLIGLLMLWRRRGGLSEAGAARVVLGGAVLGFALWNVIDVVGFHWLLGIHRIRIGVPDPLVYDLGWLALFGLVPLAVAAALLRRQGSGRNGPGAARTLAALALVGAPLAALPVPGSDGALVLLQPGAAPGPAVSALLEAGGRLVWAGDRMLAVQLPRGRGAGLLYGAGAVLVTRSPMLAGCVAAAR